MNYQRVKYPNLEEFRVNDVQAYNPIYKRFFKIDEDTYNCLALDHAIQVADLAPPLEEQVFVKFSPLLDPLSFLRGKYNLDDPKVRALPQWSDTSDNVLPKMLDPNNSSYVDAFFCYLSSKLKETRGFVHGVDFYGSFLAKQERFKYNVADDLDYILKCPEFHKNLNKHFVVDQEVSELMNEYDGVSSRRNRNKLNILDDDDNIDLDFSEPFIEGEGESNNESESNNEMKLEYENVGVEPIIESETESESELELELKSESESESKSESKSESESELELESSSDSDTTVTMESEWETESESDSSIVEYKEDDTMYSYLFDFPVHMIFQERCKGTLDKLVMTRKLKGNQLIDAFAQIVLILATYNKVFEFTHNDLHTNNIMWSPTNEPFLYYKLNGVMYKVPTHGRIFKLIDFGRAIYKYRGKLFCSDSFSPSGDAATQYNCEPYYNDKKPRIDPNVSFDLCRLGCSLYDFVVKDNDSEVEHIVTDWCNDDDGKSVLYKSNGQERYPDFKLYKMIARTVHHLVPAEQHAILEKYVTAECHDSMMDIDSW